MLKPTQSDEPEAVAADGRVLVRREGRVATVMLVARLVNDRRDQLCRVRNISANGLKVNTAFPLAVGEEIRIELRNGQAVEGKIVWSSPPFAGMHFHRTYDVETLLSSMPADDSAHVSRLPRVQINHPVLVHAGPKMLGASIIDMSQGGAKLRLRAALDRGQQVSLSVSGLSAIKATVRWTQDEEAGVAFHETIPFDTLSRWLSDRETR
ncbi:PilZ domain-containing protein [Sphingosinicella sp. BN140058]|uniref:PilZ domain-containing protein n=1 Tax=Sphingosinicella sp. BN140058 TaxID=1892855 RepID=UPI0010137CC3|nr:PilZ domain-containing protein [Sphingosinicella sp. BN140058]QAY76616.1 PilZ domain-containing protein [Sphingosinicella sp. BN140058]